ncbi:1-acyl-sn-glycerol-3-phosphate acyltransferase [uncultured bacterium]|nr:1-acyl-sn-glycerol-3-phosphate acyltransferase [uncultured bacterium]
MSVLRSSAVWAVWVPATIISFFLIALAWPFDRRGNVMHNICVLWAKVLVAVSGVRVSVRGLGNVPKGSPVLFLSNHQGAFDILALQSVLPVQFRWVAKKSLFKVPFVGWSMRLAGYISIDRENPAEAMKSMEEAAFKMDRGSSVVIFPEGTRSETGSLLPFKRGAFMLAKKCGRPIVPVAINGTGGILKKGGFIVNPMKVSISIGSPIDIGSSDEKELRNMTKRQVEAMLKGAAELA